MFCFKGTVSQDFSFRFFHELSSPKPLKIRKFVDLQNLLHLWTFRLWGKFAELGFADPIFFAICGFADPNLLRKSENSVFFCLQIHFFLSDLFQNQVPNRFIIKHD
jgi:hypothetical protein